jgi:hypothetical protein
LWARDYKDMLRQIKSLIQRHPSPLLGTGVEFFKH